MAQLPRVEIIRPAADEELVDPDTIQVEWETTWKRWDGQSYTPYYPKDFVESISVYYTVKYSIDGGRTWRKAGNGAPVKSGERPSITERVGGQQYQWNVENMREGDFLLRVEAYREGIPLHYSYHVVRQNIRR